MTHIFTWKRKKAHDRTERDIYFENLEEAYGNCPVPSDDYADIKALLVKDYCARHHLTLADAAERVEEEMESLETSITVLAEHYEAVAKAMGKEQKYG